jgi:hypothetical protein
MRFRRHEMAKYLVSWSEINWHNLVIEAESKDEAKEILLSGNFDVEDVRNIGGEENYDSIDVEEMESVRASFQSKNSVI